MEGLTGRRLREPLKTEIGIQPISKLIETTDSRLRNYHLVGKDMGSSYVPHRPSPSTTAVNGAVRELATVAMHLIKRQAADIPNEQQNDLDRAMARALARARLSRTRLVDGVQNYQRMRPTRKRNLFNLRLSDLPTTAAIDVDQIRDIIDKIGPLPLPQPVDKPSLHEVTFSHLICDEESGELDFLGSDEPFIVFGIVVPGALGLPDETRVVSTPVYAEVDDGERRPSSGSQNLRLFGESGPALIDSSSPLVITATPFERDPGAGAETATFAVATALIIASGFLVEVPPAAAALLIAGVLTGLIVGLGFFGDDILGPTLSIQLSAAEAESLTASEPLVTLPEMKFTPGFFGAEYRAVLQLRRAG